MDGGRFNGVGGCRSCGGVKPCCAAIVWVVLLWCGGEWWDVMWCGVVWCSVVNGKMKRFLIEQISDFKYVWKMNG